MAETYATEIAGQNASPKTMANGGVHGGRIRRFRATITMAAQANGDTIVLAKVPAGYAFAYGMLNSSATLGASAKVAIGIAGTAAKYKAAAVFTAAAMTLFGLSTAQDDAALTAEETVIATISVADLPGAGTFIVDLFYSAP